MNIELRYKKSLFSFDVSKSKPISYIKDIASKVFKLEKASIIINYGENPITFTDQLIKDFFLNESKAILQIEGAFPLFNISNPDPKPSRRPNGQDLNNKARRYSNQVSLGLTSDTQHTNSIICFQCSRKEVSHYCRQCDIFMCSACKLKNSLHESHKMILIQGGNVHQTALIYKKQLIDEIKQMEKEFARCKNDIPDSLLKAEVQEFALTVGSIITKKNDLCLNILPSNIKDNYFESFVSKILSISSIEKESSENVEGIYKQLQFNEKDIETIREEIENCKLQSNFKQTIYSIIKSLNHFLENTLKDLDNIYLTAMKNKYTLNGNIEQFISNNQQKPQKTIQFHLFSPEKNTPKSNLVLNYNKLIPIQKEPHYPFPKIEKSSNSIIDELSEDSLLKKKVSSRSRVIKDSFLQRNCKTLADVQIKTDDFTYSNDKTISSPFYKKLKGEEEFESDQSSHYFTKGDLETEANYKNNSAKTKFINDLAVPTFTESMGTTHYIPIDPLKSQRVSRKKLKSYIDNVI